MRLTPLAYNELLHIFTNDLEYQDITAIFALILEGLPEPKKEKIISDFYI